MNLFKKRNNMDPFMRVSKNGFGFDLETETITQYFGGGQDCIIPAKIKRVKVMRIGDNIFPKHNGINRIEIPEYVCDISKSTLYQCCDLTSINVTDRNEWYMSIDGVLFSKDGETLIQYPRGKKNKEYIVPKQVKNIGPAAFQSCANLESVTLPGSVKNIGRHAFRSCRNLKKINLPNALKSIENGVFSNCTSLINIKIPNKLTEIGAGAFSDCSLPEVVLPPGFKRIGAYAFNNCTPLIEIEIPDTVTQIDEGAFEGCGFLRSIKIPDGVTCIKHSTFRRCISLTSVSIPNSVTCIERNAFGGCLSLKRIDIPDSVVDIGVDAIESSIWLTMYCNKGSAAAKYAKENKIDVSYKKT